MDDDIREKSSALIDRGEDLRERSIRSAGRMAALITISNNLLTRKNYVVKKCGCGISYPPSLWYTLEVIGYQDTEDMAAELRNCTCGSTLSLVTRRSSK